MSMPQAEREQADVEMGDQTWVYVDWPPSASNRPSQTGFNFGDGSEPLFSIYSNIAEREDNKMAERWQRDAQGILIFTGLLSIVVAILVTMSVQDLRPRSRDDSAFYLQNIYQLLANPSVFDTLNPPPPVVTPPPFSPPRYAVWVNSLWFLSLAISLTSALLATLLHQWTRRYVTITQPIQCSPHKRARIRAFFADGVDKLHLPWIIEALPTLLHLSLALFLAGLLIFLSNVNQTAFYTVVGWVSLFVGIYACVTFMPIFRYDSPFHSPLSSTAWFLYAGTLYAVFRVLSFVPGSRDRFRDLKDRYREWVFGGVKKAAEDTVSNQPSKVDGRILEWTIDTLGEDDVIERFFGALPGFSDSKAPSHLQTKIRQVMDGFLDRTFSSDSVSESTKIDRLSICLNAAHAALGPVVVSRTLGNLFDRRWREAPQSIKMGYALRRWCSSPDEWVALTARSIVASIIAVQRRDDRWIALAEDQFGLPDRILRDNIPYGDSVLLVILLHVTRNLLHSVVPHWDSNILRVLSKFDIRNTLPQLQRDFCALWNEIVEEAHNSRPNSRPNSAPVFILREIRHLHTALHGGARSVPNGFSTSTVLGDDVAWNPSSYSLCHVTGRTSEPLPHVHASPVPFPPVPDLGPDSAHMSRFTGHNALRFPASNRGATNRRRAVLSFSDVPDAPQLSMPVATTRRHMSLENQPLFVPSLDAAATGATRGGPDTSTGTPTHPIPRNISRDGLSLQKSGETIFPSPVVSDLAPPPIPMSIASPTTDPLDPPLNLESLHAQSEDVPRAPGSPYSSPPLARLQLVSDLDSGTQDDVDSSAPIEAFRHSHPSVAADRGSSESTSQSGGYRRDSNRSWLRVANMP